MRFPPIKAGRALLWITLRDDEGVRERYNTLRAVLKTCRLHPLDTTSAAELVIVEEALLRAHQDAVRAALGTGDLLHLITTTGERLSVEVIAPPDAAADTLPEHPPWLQT